VKHKAIARTSFGAFGKAGCSQKMDGEQKRLVQILDKANLLKYFFCGYLPIRSLLRVAIFEMSKEYFFADIYLAG
jgi:hypothetical protein